MADVMTLSAAPGPPQPSILVVVAHPDDETLGAGATIHHLTQSGVRVHVCVLSGDVSARTYRPDDEALRTDSLNALGRLGVSTVVFGDFPNIQMNTVPHLQLVQFIENAVQRVGATTVITHHPGDVNDDHRQVSSACQAAARLPQRRSEGPRIHDLLFMEVLSSTDWAFGTTQFQPTLFQEVTSDDVAAKLEALAHYRDVMRPHPHPRSKDAIEAQSVLRGAQCGVGRAEAFASVFALRQETSQWH